MTNTIEQAIAYAHAHPTNNGGTWHNWCEAFVYRAGGFTASFSDAWLAALASGVLRTDHENAPAGAIHYWSNSGSSPGHVAFSLGGDQLLMASNGVTSSWGAAIGTASWSEYRANKPAMTYAGWTLYHGKEKLASSSAVASVTIDPLTQKDVATLMALKDTLSQFTAPDRGHLVVGPGFVREIIGNERLDILGKLGIVEEIKSTREYDVLAEFFRGNDDILATIAGVSASIQA